MASKEIDEPTDVEGEHSFSAPYAEGSQYSTAREESQGTSSLLFNATARGATVSSPTVIHDGNTARKEDRRERSWRRSKISPSSRGAAVLDLERSPESL